MANTVASSLITEMLDNIARISTGTTRSGALLSSRGLTILNRTLQALSREQPFIEMKKTFTTTTIANTKNYSLPTTPTTVYNSIVDMILIDGTNSRKLKVVMPDQFEKYIPYPETESTGTPAIYVPYGDNIDLFPIPDAIYTLKCRAVMSPAIMTNAALSIEYAPDKDDLIVSGMTYRALMYLQMFEDAAVWKAEYTALLKACIADDESKHLDWSPKGEGFNATGYKYPVGDYWNRIDIRSDI